MGFFDMSEDMGTILTSHLIQSDSCESNNFHVCLKMSQNFGSSASPLKPSTSTLYQPHQQPTINPHPHNHKEPPQKSTSSKVGGGGGGGGGARTRNKQKNTHHTPQHTPPK